MSQTGKRPGDVRITQPFVQRFNTQAMSQIRQWCASYPVDVPANITSKTKRAARGETVYLRFKDKNLALAFAIRFM